MNNITEESAKTRRDLLLNIDTPDADLIFKALGNPLRLRILKLLSTHAFTVSQLTENLDIPTSTINQHLKVLEEAGLIQTDLRPASRGTEKVCAGIYRRLECDLIPRVTEPERAIEISMPVGAYSDFQVTRPCGLASQHNIIGLQGDAEAFLEPDRINAQILWFATGYVEYRFPKRLPPRTHPVGLYLSLELCSEAPGHNDDWPSDITVWINDVEIGTWTSPGDFADRRGILNPDWWPSNNTQYGILKSWQVNTEGSYIDGLRISDVVIDDLQITQAAHISVRVGVKPDAEYRGGVNIFGRHFGNYPQDIVLRIVYDR
ncbi:MAG: metalloregulator ArsR/SmtB family transcription factor [Chloroflexota bacterium]